jgi:HSP20 family protein
MLQHEVNELFQKLAILDRADRLPGGEWSPPVDVLELRDRLVVLVEVAGLAPDALKVAFRERTLVVSGDRRAPRVTQGARFHCLERPHGRFERTIPLDLPVDVAAATARLAGGVLTIALPRLRERRGRETVIPIEWERSE